MAKRVGKKATLFGQIATEDELFDADSDIDDMVLDDKDSDDFDWVSKVPGRPGAYGTTWNLVYGSKMKPNFAKTGYTVVCEEGSDADIILNALRQEVGGGSTPHGALRKPPVCHIIPWVLVATAMTQLEQKSSKKFSDAFKKFACWGDTINLRTGHNACNALGTKVTTATATSSQIASAVSFVQRCIGQAPAAGVSVH